MPSVLTLAQEAKEASRLLAASAPEKRNRAINAVIAHLTSAAQDIFSANARDLEAARTQGLAEPLVKRLRFDEKKMREAIDGLRALAALPDPLHQTQLARELAPGLELYRVSCPIGVIGMIFESRPDALVQIGALCLKSGNAVLLKGGREALHTCRALHAALCAGAREAGIAAGWAQLLETREDVGEMLGLHEQIDLIIPRGSNEFVRYIMDNSRIPVMGHADGVCHVYVDGAADVDMAVRVTVDAKLQYVAVCNAAETLLVHSDIAAAFLPPAAAALRAGGARLRGCARTRAIIDCEPADDADWSAEYLDAVLAIRVVDSLDEAIAHINRYGSGHTDAIITRDQEAARRFTALVDSAGVYVNCSTRFADGYRYGFGAEVGIATGKLHARGPVGLEGLCTYKYILLGSGQTVTDTTQGRMRYTHAGLNKECPL